MFFFVLFNAEERNDDDDVDDKNYQLSSCETKKLRFVQLYTSKAFESHRSELLNPPAEEAQRRGLRHMTSSEMINEHVLSPRLVEAISSTAQVVWANTRKQEGLTGKSDVRLQTAVGMPVAVDANGNMCVVVMFSPNNISSTDDAMEFLRSISQSATSSSIPCLLPALDAKSTGMRPISSMQPQQDFITQALTPSLNRLRLGEGVTARFMSFPEEGSDSPNSEPEVHSDHELSLAPKDTFGIPMLPSFAEIGNVTPDENIEIFDEASYGIWSTIMGTNLEDGQQLDPSQAFDFSRELQAMSESDSNEPDSIPPQKMSSALVLSHPTSLLQENRRQRLEEFCEAFLGMSVFDLADVWVPVGEEEPESLRMAMSVASTASNDYVNQFRLCSELSVIKFWAGAVGRAFSSGNPVWTANPNVFMDPQRAQAFCDANIKTVLAVPVFSGKQSLPTCVVACYSLVRSGSVPFVLRFVQQALRLLWDGLEGVKPHESVCRNIWNDVAPADLGEMAADVEMQQHFMSKKRPYRQISEVEQSQSPEEAAAERPAYSSTRMHSIRMPDGEIVTVPLQLSDVMPSQPEQKIQYQKVQSHLVDALKSVGNAVPFDHVATNQEGTKRAHIMGPISGTGHSPLPFPKQVIGNPMSRPNAAAAAAPAPSISTAASTAMYASSAPAPPVAKAAPVNPVGFVPPINLPNLEPAAPVPARNVSVDNLGSQFCIPVGEKTDSNAAQSSKLCRIQGCDEQAVPRRPYCVRHSGNRTCEHPDCTKCAQGSTRFCIAHGGGRRCTFPGCDKGARDKFFCAAHGGGKRCKMEGCTKSAVGGSSLCTSHGGGRRCAVEGCDKSAQSSTKFCVKHGGGKKCAHEGCAKVARGRTQYCAAHGGGIRCKLEGCNRVAIGKMQLCRAHGGGSRAKKNPGNSVSEMNQAAQMSQQNGLLGGTYSGIPINYMSV